MTKQLVPGAIFFLALISLLILRSVAPGLVERQLLFLSLGAVVYWLTTRISFRQWQQLRWVLYSGVVLALASTQLLATVTRGTRSWIELGPFHAQPSQLAVAVVALAVSHLVAGWQSVTVVQYLKLLLVMAIPAGFILMEPDLGTTAIYGLAMLPVFTSLRVPRRYLLATAVAGLGLLLLSWLFFLKPYQKQRITSFLATDQHTQAASYNAIQSMIAVGSGGLTGRGLGQGTQSQLRFLPERQTDFVFASFVEETGFLGGVIVIGLYAILISSCLSLAIQLPERGARLFALITAVMFLAQVGVNIGMNIGLVPITGITLPFISYGGSSVLALSFQLGLLASAFQVLPRRPKLWIR